MDAPPSRFTMACGAARMPVNAAHVSHDVGAAPAPSGAGADRGYVASVRSSLVRRYLTSLR